MSQFPTPPKLPAKAREQDPKLYAISDMVATMLSQAYDSDTAQEILIELGAIVAHPEARTHRRRIIMDGAHIFILGAVPEGMELTPKTLFDLTIKVDEQIAKRTAAGSAHN